MLSLLSKPLLHTFHGGVQAGMLFRERAAVCALISTDATFKDGQSEDPFLVGRPEIHPAGLFRLCVLLFHINLICQ